MSAVSNKQGLEEFSPIGVGSNFECDYDEYDYGRIGKAIVHVYLIPLLIWGVFKFLAPEMSLVVAVSYIGCVAFLYLTVFHEKSQEFFGVLIATLLFLAVIMVPN